MRPRIAVLSAAALTSACVVLPLPAARPVPAALRAHPRPVRWLEYSRDGAYLLSASHDGPVILWDAARRQPAGPPIAAARSGLRAAALAPDAGLVAAGHEDGSVVLLDARNPGAAATRFPSRHRRSVTALAFSADGRTLVSAGEDATVVFWDVAGRSERDRLAAGSAVARVAFSPDGALVVLAGPRRLTVIDATTRETVASLAGDDGPLGDVAFVGDRRQIARTGGGFALWDVRVGRCLWGTDTGCADDARRLGNRAGLAVAPDGRRMAVGARSGDGLIELWDVEDRVRTASLRGHGGNRWAVALMVGWTAGGGAFTSTTIRALAFSPDGRVLASGGDDGAIIFWSMETLEPMGLP